MRVKGALNGIEERVNKMASVRRGETQQRRCWGGEGGGGKRSDKTEGRRTGAHENAKNPIMLIERIFNTLNFTLTNRFKRIKDKLGQLHNNRECNEVLEEKENSKRYIAYQFSSMNSLFI